MVASSAKGEKKRQQEIDGKVEAEREREGEGEGWGMEEKGPSSYLVHIN